MILQQVLKTLRTCGSVTKLDSLNARVETSLLEGCVFDVGFTGYSEFAYRTAQVSNILDIVESVIPGFKNPIPGILRQLPKIPGLPF